MSDSDVGYCDRWLFRFRRKLNSPCDTLKFLNKAINYSPHYYFDGCDTYPCSKEQSIKFGDTLESSSLDTNFRCNGVVIYSVLDVYRRGIQTLVKCADVNIDLCKIYLILTEAIKRVRSSIKEEKEHENLYQRALQVLYALLRRFQRYVTISTMLTENSLCSKSPTKSSPQKSEPLFPDLCISKKAVSFIKDFRIDYSNWRNLLGLANRKSDVVEILTEDRGTQMIRWSFYKNATCSDIFALLCYTLVIGNFEAFKIILMNGYECMLDHLKEHWKIILSYIPISCDYRNCRYILEVVLDISHEQNPLDCSNAMDWAIWRSFVIINYTGSSYYLLLKFVTMMYKIFDKIVTDDKNLKGKLELLLFSKCLVKQYLIYRSFKTTTLDLKALEARDYLSLLEYLQLKACDKFQLFFDSMGPFSSESVGCDCMEIYKDKYKIYKSCLYCKTIGVSKKLNVFFKLIIPLDQKRALTNQFLSLNKDFNVYFNALINAMNCELVDYMDGIYHSFREGLDTQKFETLYALTDALLQTSLRPKVDSFLLDVLYNKKTRYNVLEHFFIIKSLFSLIHIYDDVSTGEEYTRGDSSATFDIPNSHLNDLKPQSEVADAIPSHSHYAEFCKAAENSSVVDMRLISPAIRCQMNFMDSILNLFSLVNVVCDHTIDLFIGMDELTAALCDMGCALSLIQKIFLFLLRRSVSIENFRSSIYTLVDASLYITRLNLNDINLLFFYTICLFSNSIPYLETQLKLWFRSSTDSLETIIEFIRASINGVYLTVCMLSMKRFSHPFARLISEFCHSCRYLNCFKYIKGSPKEQSMEIHDLIKVYLDTIGLDWDGNFKPGGSSCIMQGIYKDVIIKDELIMTEFFRLGILQRFSVVLSDIPRNICISSPRAPHLSYRIYEDKRDLVVQGLSTLVDTFFKCKDALCFKNNERNLALRAFDCVVSNAIDGFDAEEFGTDQYIKKLYYIKNVAVLVFPEEFRQYIQEVAEILTKIASQTISNYTLSPHLFRLETTNPIISILCSTSFIEKKNYENVAKICKFSSRTQLPSLLSFVSKNIYCGQLSGRLSQRELVTQVVEVTPYDFLVGNTNSSDMLTSSYDAPSHKVDDTSVRISILKLLSNVNVSKIEVNHRDKMKVSFDKLANKFTANVAGGFFSAALDKAETGLSTIAMKKMRFETIKDKLWIRSKRKIDNVNVCFLPILNYFDSSTLAHCNYDFDFIESSKHSEENFSDFSKWRSLNHLEIARFMEFDAKFGSLALLELCNFRFCDLFLGHMNKIFNLLNIANCIKVLDYLLPNIKHLRWPTDVLQSLISIYNFFLQFTNFPLEADIMIGRLVTDPEYRVSLFSGIPYFVAKNINLFHQVYLCLDHLFSSRSLDIAIDGGYNHVKGEFIAEEIIKQLWEDRCIKQGHDIRNEDLKKEYLDVLMGSYRQTFWDDSSPDNLTDSFKILEPEFLLYPLEYGNCLLTMYSGLKSLKAGSTKKWLLWRKSVCKLLSLHPEMINMFKGFYMPDSKDVVNLLETVSRVIDDFDVTIVDNFEHFKRLLLKEINLNNYFEIAHAMCKVDRAFTSIIYRNAEMQLRPHSNDLFDATRALYEFDLSSSTL